MCDNDLVEMMFSGLAPLVIDSVDRQGSVIRVKARTPSVPVPCLDCQMLARQVHSYHRRRLADVVVDDCPVTVDVTVRRLICQNGACPRRTFREQTPGVTERYQRRTVRLASAIGAVVRKLAGRASSRVLEALRATVSRHTCLRMLLRLPLPKVRVPRVLGMDDFALRRRHRYATILIAEPTPSKHGFATIPVWRWCAATPRAHMPRPSAGHYPRLSK